MSVAVLAVFQTLGSGVYVWLWTKTSGAAWRVLTLGLFSTPKPFDGSRSRDVQVCQHCGTVWGRDANSATNMRHALMEMLLGNKRPAALRPGGGGGPGPSGGGGDAGPGPGGGGGGGGEHVRCRVGGKGHVEEESAAPPKERRRRAG